MERLNSVGKSIQERGATVTMASIDALDAATLRDFILKQDDALPVDLVVAAAGFITPPNASSYALSDVFSALFASTAGNRDHPQGECGHVQELSVAPSGSHARAKERADLHRVLRSGTRNEERESDLHLHEDGDLRPWRGYIMGAESDIALRILLEPSGVFVNIVCPGSMVEKN